jgi:Ser/Thr protein kinase RdoA (MazF antagonist)
MDVLGLRGDGRLIQLNSYENRVFQVFLEDGSAVVAKAYRPGRWSDAQILEEHAFALEAAAAEVPVVPPLALRAVEPLDPALRLGTPPRWTEADADLESPDAAGAAHQPTLACWPDADGDASRGLGLRLAVAERRAGREPELDDPEVLLRIGRFLGRLHAVGRRRPFEHRLTMQPALDARSAIDSLLAGDSMPSEQRPAWAQAADSAATLIARAFEATPPQRLLRLHGDCHPGNILWRDGVPHVVDLDDALQGPAVQDLWMLASGDAGSMRSQLLTLLEGYTAFSAFDERELALIEPLRTLRMLRHSAWLAARWSDPSFPLNFPFFGSAAYWSQQTAQLREQIEAMQGG